VKKGRRDAPATDVTNNVHDANRLVTALQH
jgi:hypothetical protein